ncbi:hypothetical protein Z948_2372 [Sulfitobacter donghicola DSW-25 = KCTC 12864 = JCM 14565]|nr:hypothetical protein Z948_2372 [Sulfitobacter donghicola DSW-25 = KCTC 12864 = JCM 14565]
MIANSINFTGFVSTSLGGSATFWLRIRKPLPAFFRRKGF